MDLPVRGPNESADQYLNRLRDYERIRLQAEKERIRSDKRIRSEVERILIERAVKEALKPPVKRPQIDPRLNRWYRLPGPGAGLLLIFYPLYLLISLIFQDATKTDNRYEEGISISRGDKMK